MIRTILVLTLLPLLLGGCLKSTTKATIKADGSGTMHYETSYSIEAVESSRQRIDDMRARMEEAGRDSGRADQAEERLDRFIGGFETDRMRTELQECGLEVSSLKSFEKDGWKGVTVEATFKDIGLVMNRLREKREAARQADQPEQPDAGGEGRPRRGMMRGFGAASNLDNTPMMVSAFRQTPDEKIGRAVLLPPREAPAQGAGPEGRGRGRGGFGGGMQGMEEFRRTLWLTLPGKVLETHNCRKENDTTVVVEMKGSDLSPDEDGNLPPLLSGGAWATFQIPDGCTLSFEGQGPKPPGQKEDAPEEEKEKKKKGDLRIGDG